MVSPLNPMCDVVVGTIFLLTGRKPYDASVRIELLRRTSVHIYRCTKCPQISASISLVLPFPSSSLKTEKRLFGLREKLWNPLLCATSLPMLNVIKMARVLSFFRPSSPPPLLFTLAFDWLCFNSLMNCDNLLDISSRLSVSFPQLHANVSVRAIPRIRVEFTIFVRYPFSSDLLLVAELECSFFLEQ
ncbi:hypothetical protein Tco_0520975 [Tanacetum coccineum]